LLASSSGGASALQPTVKTRLTPHPHEKGVLTWGNRPLSSLLGSTVI
jgi:hypothetical protein